MDDLIKICDELEQCKEKRSCYCDEIACTRSKVKSYIGEDDNKRLKLKAQLKQHDKDTSQSAIAGISLIVSVVTLIVTVISAVCKSATVSAKIYMCWMLMIIVLVSGIYAWSEKKYGYRGKWKKYIQVVLEDMENQSI